MNPVATLFLAFAMSTDAFAAAIGKGAALNRPHWREALRTGLIFGVIEAITPIIGWLLGRAADGSMRDAMSLTDQAIAFGEGKVLAAGTPEEIRSHKEVVSAYLGG